jgi:hypothetical protein
VHNENKIARAKEKEKEQQNRRQTAVRGYSVSKVVEVRVGSNKASRLV